MYSFVYLYMYSVEWSRRRRGSGWIVRLKTIYIASITCASTSPRSCLPLLFALRFFLHLLLLDSLRNRFSRVCELIYSISLYSPTFFFFFSPHLLSGAAIYRREDVERSELSKLAARAQRDRAVSRLSDFADKVRSSFA